MLMFTFNSNIPPLGLLGKEGGPLCLCAKLTLLPSSFLKNFLILLNIFFPCPVKHRAEAISRSHFHFSDKCWNFWANYLFTKHIVHLHVHFHLYLPRTLWILLLLENDGPSPYLNILEWLLTSSSVAVLESLEKSDSLHDNFLSL